MGKNWKLLGVASGALMVMAFQWQPPNEPAAEESHRRYEQPRNAQALARNSSADRPRTLIEASLPLQHSTQR